MIRGRNPFLDHQTDRRDPYARLALAVLARAYTDFWSPCRRSRRPFGEPFALVLERTIAAGRWLYVEDDRSIWFDLADYPRDRVQVDAPDPLAQMTPRRRLTLLEGWLAQETGRAVGPVANRRRRTHGSVRRTRVAPVGSSVLPASGNGHGMA